MRTVTLWTRKVWKGLRENRLFWGAVALVAAVAPFVILASYPLSVALLVADLFGVTALLCAWLEQQRSPQK